MIFRYMWFAFCALILEKPRGLDFHMRDTHIILESRGKCHGCAVTSESHLKQIFMTVNVSGVV
jgi:hypothetical protein